MPANLVSQTVANRHELAGGDIEGLALVRRRGMLHRDDELISNRDINDVRAKRATGQWTQLGHEVVADLRPSVVVTRDWYKRRTTSPSARVGIIASCHANPARVVVDRRADDGAVKLKLDLHDIYNRGGDIDRALRAVIDDAVAKKAPLVEIIPGKGSGALKKRVLRFLDQKEIKALYHRVDKDSDNFGRVFVHFRWK